MSAAYATSTSAAIDAGSGAAPALVRGVDESGGDSLMYVLLSVVQ